MPRHPPAPSPSSDREPPLRWVRSDGPGLRREGEAGHFRYLNPDGRLVRDPAVLARIRTLAIPPAWQGVWICEDPQGHLQATGRDGRGRRQYLYHPRWRQQRSERKFAQLLAFGQGLPALRSRLRRCLAGDAAPTRERVLAALVQLLDCSWMRIGEERYVRANGSYGLSTLRSHHLRLHGQSLHLRFVGKTGVDHRVSLCDPRLAAVVRRCRELPGDELFQYLDDAGELHRVGSADVNAWLQAQLGPGMSAKVFRTWHGTVLALGLVLAQARRAQAPDLPAIIRQVAARLGNTPAVCRASYVHPAVLALAGALADPVPRTLLGEQAWYQAPRRRGLSRTESRLLAMLAQPRPLAGSAARPRPSAGRGARDRAAAP